MRRRRILLLAVAGLLSVAALLAIAILLVGRFGDTERRVVGTTLLLRELFAASCLTAAVAAGAAVAAIWAQPSGTL